jgi:hypothetical protein
VPPDSVRCTRVDQLELATFGFLEKPLRYNSLDCPVCQRSNGSSATVDSNGGHRGRETRRRAQVRTCRSTASAEKAELTELAHSAGREDKGVRATARRLGIRVHETEREGERAGEGKLAPTDRLQQAECERERARERGTAADRWGPLVRRRERAGARPGWA